MTAKLLKMTRILKLLGLLLFLVLAHNIEAQQGVDSTYLRLIDSCYIAGDEGKYQKAISYLERAINLQPKHPMTPYLMGNIAGLEQLEGRYDRALLAYDAALKKAPDLDELRFNRALLSAKLGRQKEALTDYSLLIARHPKNELYRYHRAMLYILEQRYDEAEIDLKYILEQNSESLKAREGYALLETIRGRYDEAERLYDYLVERLSSTPQIYEGRARLYLKRNMMGYALRDTNKAFELSHGKPSAQLYLLRSEINERLGDKKAAAADRRLAEQLLKVSDPLFHQSSH